MSNPTGYAVTKPSRQTEIPISLGKPSLRQRMEAYYKLVNPEAIQDQEKWRATFHQIYEKFGGK